MFDVCDMSDEPSEADSPHNSILEEDVCEGDEDDELQLPMSPGDSSDEDGDLQLPLEVPGCQPPQGCQPSPGYQPLGNVPSLRAPGPGSQALGSQILRELPLSQFVLPPGVHQPNLNVSGVLDMWSGCKRFAFHCVQHGAPWVLTYDYKDDPMQQDLLAAHPPSI